MHSAIRSGSFGGVAFALLAGSILGCGASQAAPATGPVTAIEVTSSGEELVVPPTGVTDVDVNSSIKLVVDEKKAKAALAGSVGVRSDDVSDIAAKIDRLRAAVASQRAALGGIEANLRNPPSLANVRAAMADQGRLEDKALDDLVKVLSKREIDELLALGVQGGYAATIERLEAQRVEQQRALDALQTRLARVRLRLQASLFSKSGETPLHLEGYDNLPVAAPNVINKLALPDNLLATLDKARAAAQDIGDLKTALDRARSNLLDRLKDLETRLEKIQALVDELPSVLDDAQRAPWASVAPGAKVVADVRGMIQGAQPLAAPCRDAVELLRHTGLGSPGLLLGLVKDANSSVRRCADALVKQGPGLVNDAKALAADVTALRQAAASDAALAKTVAADTLAKLDALVAKAEADALGDFSDYWQTLQILFGGSEAVAGTPVFAASPAPVDRAYADVASSSIDLVRSPRADGDLVYHHSGVVTDGQETQSWTSAPLRVVVTGFHINVSPSVVFVRAFSRQPQDSSFPAAPSVAAAVHYGVRRASGKNQGCPFWRFIDPGFGLHVAYLDLGPKVPAGTTAPPADPATEIGVGGTLQLFGDVIQGGIAYDLQVERPYWFFGIGLQTATNFGLTIPSK